jgi:hypothetical protein
VFHRSGAVPRFGPRLDSHRPFGSLLGNGSPSVQITNTVRLLQVDEDYGRLKGLWLAGRRDREGLLNLHFLCWMHWADPYIEEWTEGDSEAAALWREVFEYFGGESASDAEFLHVSALMAGLFPWVLGDEAEWKARADRLAARVRDLRPEGFQPEHFSGRGEYGKYFAHQFRGWADDRL